MFFEKGADSLADQFGGHLDKSRVVLLFGAAAVTVILEGLLLGRGGGVAIVDRGVEGH